MKTRALSAVLVAAMAAAPGGAYADFRNTRVVSAPAIVVDALLLRPFGFAATLVGTAFFVGTLPFTGIANIPPPHDAIDRTANALIRAPGAFTFLRPLGEMSYQPSGVYPVRPEEPLGTGYPGGYDVAPDRSAAPPTAPTRRPAP